MKLLNFLFTQAQHTTTKIQRVVEENKGDLLLLHEDLINLTGQDINSDIIKEIALKRLLECYNTRELIQIFKFYKVIK